MTKFDCIFYMTSKIAFFFGSDASPPINVLYENLSDLISDHFEIDFVGFYKTEKFGKKVNEYIYDFPSEKGLKRMLYSCETLKNYLEKNEPDLIVLAQKHGVYALPVLLSANLNKTIIRLNIDIFNFYKDELYENRINRFKSYLINNLLSKITLNKALGVIVQTDYMYEQCERKGIDSEKLSVIPLPINEDRFKKVTKKEKNKFRNQLDIGKDENIALIVGSKSTRKRHHFLDQLLTNTHNLKDIQFIIIGRTDYGKKLSQKYSNVRYEGYVNHDELPKYYQAGDFLLHFAKIEGFPTVFQEANACGLPIIAKRANYNETLDICKYDDLEELEEMLKNKIWRKIETNVTSGLSKQEYINYFERMIEKAEKNK